MTVTIRPFTLDPNPAGIADLRDRLAGMRSPLDLDFKGNRGRRPDSVTPLLEAWRNDFDWDAFVARVNALPQFIAEVDGQPIHFLHVRSSRKSAIPLLLLHGFPSSFVEFLPVINALTEPDGDAQAFHVVLPTHPGYGYSLPLVAPIDSPGTARLYARLMADLGYQHYVAHGGDYGAWMAPDLGRVDPDHVRGIHVTAASVGFIPFHTVEGEEFDSLSSQEQAKIAHLADYMADLNWYYDVQAKRPQTLAYAMADSPAGLGAWLLELFDNFSNDDHPLLDNPENRELVFANLTIWWLTNCFGPAANVTYWEGAQAQPDLSNSGIPTGVASAPDDASIRRYSEPWNTIVHWTNLERGGHFGGMEFPDLLVRDIRDFVSALKP